jgi:hypothetical protein
MSTVDFQALIPRDWSHQGFTLHVSRGIRLGGGSAFFTAKVVRRRISEQTGRELAGDHVITLCGDPGGTIPDLLRTLAGLFERNEPVEVVQP